MKANLQLYIEGNRVDLFKDESINVIESIQDVRDISKVFFEFSRTFSIPASKRNNKIFKHYYNYSISDGFDARLKKAATLEINHRPYKTGKIKLDGVDLKDNTPEQYRITFFGNTIDLNDLIGDDDLSALDLTAFDTDYTATDVQTALEDGVSKTYTRADSTTLTFPNGIIAPLISHTTRLYYDGTGTTAFPDAGGGDLKPKGVHAGVYWKELKYAIKIDAIIRAIEDKYGLTFSNDFFSTNNSPYSQLYMWLHRKKGNAFDDTTVSKLLTGFDPDYYQEIPEVGMFSDRLVVQNVSSGSIQYSLTIEATSSITGTIIIKKNGNNVVNTREINGTSQTLTGYLDNGTYTVYLESSLSSFDLNTDTQWDLNPTYYPDAAAEYPLASTYTFNNTRSFIVSEQIPEMKIIDFLNGIFTLFNLTAYTENGTIIVKTLDSYYDDSNVVWDITDQVDSETQAVNVALPYKEIELKFEGLGTKLAQQHNQLSNISWGTEEYRGDDYYDANPETYEVKVPFEHMKFERMYDGTATTIQVGWFVDDNSAPYYGKPLLFYAKNQTAGNTIRFLTGETSGHNDITSYWIPINSLDIDPTESDVNLNFRNELSEYTNTNEFDQTLFVKYYQTYISDVFKLDRRLTTIGAYLNLKMLQELSLADLIAINDRNYYINKIETDYSTGKSKLELINTDTVSIGGSDPVDTTTVDPNACQECSADSTFCTVDSLTPTADKVCVEGRSVTISGPTTAQTTNNITLVATENNFVGTPSYLWAGGAAAGLTTSSITITETNTGNVTYTCTVTDSDDSEDFSDTHIVLWTPKTYRITLNIVNNITGDSAGYNISGDQSGDYQDLEEGQTYSFNTTVTPNSNYEFTTGPVIQNAQGIVGTSNLTVNTTLSGSVQSSSEFITITGPTQKTINNDLPLGAYATGFTPTSYTWSGGSLSNADCVDSNDCYQVLFTETTAGTYTYTLEASDGTNTYTDTHTVIWSTQNLIDVTLSVDTSNISASGFSPVSNGFTIGGDLDGTVKTQNAGTVFNFQTTISLNSGFEWVGNPPTVNNAGGTYTTSQTVTTDFTSATIQLIVYNYYVVTGCAGTSVAGDTKYVRTRDTLTVGSSSTGTYLTIDQNCWYTSATAFETDWATNNGITVGNGEGTGCSTCTNVTTTDPCLNTKSLMYLRYSTTNDVCENQQNKGYYYVDGTNVSQDQTTFCNRTNLYTYADCTVNAPAGYYSLDLDNTERRYWNGSSFSVCVNCVDANLLYFLGTGWNVLNQYCNDPSRVSGYYYFDNNATLSTANSSEHMYTSASNIGTTNRAAEGFYTDGTVYRYYEPNSLQVWSSYGTCPAVPTTTTTTTIPTLTVFRQYVDCPTGQDSTKVFGNNSTGGFPAVIKDGNGDCWKDPVPTALTSSDWVGSFDHYDNCTDCTGGTTTLPATTTTTRPDNVFVMENAAGNTDYVQLDSAYNVGNQNLTISSDPNVCYDIIGKSAVLDPTIYGTITGACTTTTTTTTTTTAFCGSQVLYKSTVSAADACCNQTVAKTVYMDSNDISTATEIYSTSTCGSLVTTTTYFTKDFIDYYIWDAITQTLSGPVSCPNCNTT